MKAPAALERIDPSALNLKRLTPAERRELAALMENRFGGEGLADYIRRTRPKEHPPRHLLPIISLFERAKRENVQACISMPPRSGKSTTIRSACAHWLTHSPADVLAYASYNLDIAGEQSYLIRDETRAAGVTLAGDHQAREDWRTAAGGGLIAAGVGTSLTGRGVTGFAIVDDPFKDYEEANSPTMRDRVWNWFNSVVMTRGEGWASTIVCHTRWHDDDLTGRLEREGGWEIVRIAALSEDGESDILGRAPGESFWPGRPRFTREALESRRSRDDYIFSALFQQRPRSKGRKVFWASPTYWDPKVDSNSGWTAIIGADPAASEKTSADWSVALSMAIKKDGTTPDKCRGRILDVYRKQVTVPQFARDLVSFIIANHSAPAAVEAVGPFKALPQMMYETAPALRGRIVELSTSQQLHGDKFLRAQSFATAWNEGRIEVPLGAPWLEAFLAELYAFTGVKDKHDDQIDSGSHAWNTATGGNGPVKRGAVADPSRW